MLILMILLAIDGGWNGTRITGTTSGSFSLVGCFLSYFITWEQEGGAIRIVGGGTLRFDSSTFYRCYNLGSAARGGVCYVDAFGFFLQRCCVHGCSSSEGQFAYLIGNSGNEMAGNELTFLTWGPEPGPGLTQSAGIYDAELHLDLSRANFPSCSISGEGTIIATIDGDFTLAVSNVLIVQAHGISIIDSHFTNQVSITSCNLYENSVEPGGFLLRLASSATFFRCCFSGVLSVSVPSGMEFGIYASSFVGSIPAFVTGYDNVAIDTQRAMEMSRLLTWFCPAGTIPAHIRSPSRSTPASRSLAPYPSCSPTSEFTKQFRSFRRRMLVMSAFYVVGVLLSTQ
jgi:hypothetical protein